MTIASLSRFHRVVVAAALTVMVGAVPTCGRSADESRTPAETSRAGSSVAARDPAPAARSVDASPPASGGLDQSELFVILEPVGKGDTPAELLITEPLGGRAGIEAGNHRAVRENTRAWYDSSPPLTMTDDDPETGPLPKQYSLVTPGAGTYNVDVVGRRDGLYSLIVRVIMPGGETWEADVRGARIRGGEVHRFSFAYERGTSAPPVISRR